MKKRAIAFCLVLSFLLCFCESSTVGGLAIILCVDQMIPEYLNPSIFNFQGGLARLEREGFSFSNAILNYALTLTGPGHTTLATGCYPRTHGIVANEWVNPDTMTRIYCVRDPEAKPVDGMGGNCSPKNLKVDTLGDWMKMQNPGSRVYSVAGKDRSAVLMGGHHPDGVFWRDSTGAMVTSTYYMNQLPAWLKSKQDTSKTEDSMDETVLQLATRIVLAEKLGQRNAFDLLCIGLSATDYIGHDFGPESPQMRANLSRLDHAMGDFFQTILKDKSRKIALVALTADHGVHPYFGKKSDERRFAMSEELRNAISGLNAQLKKEWGLSSDLVISKGSVDGKFVNYNLLIDRGIDKKTAQDRIREALIKTVAIEDVYFREEMVAPPDPAKPFSGLFHNSYFPQLQDSFWIRFCENCMDPGSDVATHGSPYPSDTQIPLLFWQPGSHAGRSERPVHSVDVAPTLAAFLKVKVPSYVDGKPISDVLDWFQKGQR